MKLRLSIRATALAALALTAVVVHSKPLDSRLSLQYDETEKCSFVLLDDSPLGGGIEFSAQYDWPGHVFRTPKNVTFVLERSSKMADWKNARKLKFAVAGHSLVFTPKYHDLGDAKDALPGGKAKVSRTELLIIEIPLAQARLIANGKSVVVSSEPKSFSVPFTASARAAFKALVGSIDSPPAQARKRPDPPARVPKKLEEDINISATGLPVNEMAPMGLATQITTPVKVGKDIIFAAVAVKIDNPRSQLKYPNVTLHFAAYGNSLRWGGATRVTLTYAGKSHELDADATSNTEYDGQLRDTLQVLLPYADFAELVQSPTFTFTVNKDTFALTQAQTGGLRALLAKIKPTAPPAS